jgi:hypothetical protein
MFHIGELRVMGVVNCMRFSMGTASGTEVPTLGHRQIVEQFLWQDTCSPMFLHRSAIHVYMCFYMSVDVNSWLLYITKDSSSPGSPQQVQAH